MYVDAKMRLLKMLIIALSVIVNMNDSMCSTMNIEITASFAFPAKVQCEYLMLKYFDE